LERADGAAPRGFDDGSDIGVEVGAPLRSEAVCHLAEDDAGAQRPLGAVVGRLDGAVGEEDEQVSPATFDGVLQLFAGRMDGGDPHQAVERGVEQ
jgi:hypothetical protein